MSELSHLCFRDEAWLPLHVDRVLDYFSISPFYDQQSNNAVAARAGKHLDEMSNVVGKEYRLDTNSSRPPALYIIWGLNRTSPTDLKPADVFFVLEGTIYMAPLLASLLASRVAKIAHYVNQAVDVLHSQASFDLAQGYTWDFDAPTDAVEAADADVAASPAAVSAVASPAGEATPNPPAETAVLPVVTAYLPPSFLDSLAPPASTKRELPPDAAVASGAPPAKRAKTTGST
ncbi:uncharacterized protein AMSG_03838 [Thecamonas trahens ATCC 50062]|uniref:Mediator of RNA polymerase II transcription subunit 6 n=1 Tax=Thecamonas trahens ATCC 50062 TaxID=461836 RepID=A0A0L0D4Z5_THETB|nr:hypothetical protein AMSG_03838 [Thecamonas trahens ATCC 50062]KNC47404.1 hypothetical protein AMSG_03838 [Thecamonas trahens ATCC 50062]|eukprot:XP_013759742.1 hypothetical protein AMSG_03838 [Thecamonas trahens ATCC 50062]